MFKLNTQRTYSYRVALTVLEGNEEKTGAFTATFKVVPNSELGKPENKHKRLLDLVFVGASDIEVAGNDGQLLEGDDLVDALRNDPAVANALVIAYQESVTKKAPTRT